MRYAAFLSILLLGCSPKDDFESLSREIYKSANLPLDKIINQKKYDYWEYRQQFFGRNETILFKSGINHGDSIHSEGQHGGFFVGCSPLMCSFYILAKANDKVDIIDTEDKFKAFIVPVDNIEEVILLIKVNGYWFNPNDKRTGSFRKIDDGYELYILDYNSCPVTEKSVHAKINRNGELKIISG